MKVFIMLCFCGLSYALSAHRIQWAKQPTTDTGWVATRVHDQYSVHGQRCREGGCDESWLGLGAKCKAPELFCSDASDSKGVQIQPQSSSRVFRHHAKPHHAHHHALLPYGTHHATHPRVPRWQHEMGDYALLRRGSDFPRHYRETYYCGSRLLKSHFRDCLHRRVHRRFYDQRHNFRLHRRRSDDHPSRGCIPNLPTAPHRGRCRYRNSPARRSPWGRSRTVNIRSIRRNRQADLC